MVSVGQGVGCTGKRLLVQIPGPTEELSAGCIAIILVLGDRQKDPWDPVSCRFSDRPCIKK